MSTEKYKRAGLLLTEMLENMLSDNNFMMRDDVDSLALLKALEPAR